MFRARLLWKTSVYIFLYSKLFSAFKNNESHDLVFFILLDECFSSKQRVRTPRSKFATHFPYFFLSFCLAKLSGLFVEIEITTFSVVGLVPEESRDTQITIKDVKSPLFRLAVSYQRQCSTMGVKYIDPRCFHFKCYRNVLRHLWPIGFEALDLKN